MKSKIIIVGNGGSLAGSEQAEFIDNYDVVVRINNWVANKDVGYRCCLHYSTKQFTEGMRADFHINRGQDHIPHWCSGSTGVGLWRIMSSWIKSMYSNFTPSSGLLVIAHAMQDHCPIDIIGFDGLVYKAKLHYWNDEVYDGSSHYQYAESDVMSAWEESNLVRRVGKDTQ